MDRDRAGKPRLARGLKLVELEGRGAVPLAAARQQHLAELLGGSQRLRQREADIKQQACAARLRAVQRDELPAAGAELALERREQVLRRDDAARVCREIAAEFRGGDEGDEVGGAG